jgi:asparagine N-glycosylation enzyme membrane subunit Stt3
MLRRKVEGAGLFAAIFLLLPLPYYLVTVQPRFRHPMEPLIAVLAVFLFRSAKEKSVEGRA